MFIYIYYQFIHINCWGQLTKIKYTPRLWQLNWGKLVINQWME